MKERERERERERETEREREKERERDEGNRYGLKRWEGTKINEEYTKINILNFPDICSPPFVEL